MNSIPISPQTQTQNEVEIRNQAKYQDQMAAYSNILKLSFLASLLSGLWPLEETRQHDTNLAVFPPTCNRIECPVFETVHVGNGYEIRRYNSTMWASTSPIQDISLVEATRTGFLQKFEDLVEEVVKISKSRIEMNKKNL